MLSVFGTGRSANLIRDLFMSEHLWVNLSSRNMLYQLSYVILIERSIDTNLIVYVDVIVNQAEYQYEVWKGSGTRAERLENLSMHVFFRVSPCHLHCTVMLMLKKLLNKRTFKFNCRERIRQSKRKVKCRASRYLTLFSCNKLMCSCKSEAHIANYCNSKLSGDPNKTIAVP